MLNTHEDDNIVEKGLRRDDLKNQSNKARRESGIPPGDLPNVCQTFEHDRRLPYGKLHIFTIYVYLFYLCVPFPCTGLSNI